MTQTARIIIKNTFWLWLAEVVNGALMLLLTIQIARYLGSAQYGRLSFALSLTSLGGLIVDFGFGILMVREIARDRNMTRQYLSNILTFRLVLSFVFILAMLAIGGLTRQPATIFGLIMLMAVSTVMNNMIQTFTAVFRGHEHMEFEAFSRILLSASLVGVGLYLIAARLPLVFFGWMYIVAHAFTLLIVSYIVKHKFSTYRLSITHKFWKYLASESWPFALSLAFISVYYSMDTVMLGFMGRDTEVGWYNADYKIILLLLLMGSALGNSFFPLISRLFKESLERLRVLLCDFSKLMVTIALPIGLGGVILARPIISLIYGQEFLGGVLALQILVWTVVVAFISGVYGNSLQASDRQRLFVRGVGMGAFINLGLNFLLIPRYSLNGAAVATLMAELAVFVYMYMQFRRIIKVPFWPFLPKVLLAGSVMSVVLLVLRSWPVLVLIPLGIIIYGAVLYATGGVAKREITQFRNIITKRYT